MKTKSTKCNNCGGSLRFSPKTGNLCCKKCGSEVQIDMSNDYTKHSIDMTKTFVEPEVKESIVSKHCDNCGATFKGELNKISSTCSYCGANLVLNFSNKTGINPDACIPFAFDRKEAGDRFKKGLKKKAFLPSKFKKSPPVENIESVYIPAFTFNCKTENKYSGKLIYEDKDKDGRTHYHYRSISGTETVISKNMMIECSEHLTQTAFNQIKPFDTSQMFRFEEEFILGYSVEYYNRKIEDVKKMVKSMVEDKVREKILSNYSYDRVDYLHIDTRYTESDYSYVILPTYKVKYKYHKKEYTTFMNGQTGKVGGNVPRSGLKISALVLSILAVVGAIVYFIVKNI